jgi:hypothetical protein
MRGINKSIVYTYLKKCEENTGGYTGTDIVKLAQQLNVDRTTLSRNIEKWSETDARFSDIKYLGKRYIPLPMNEILEIERNLKDNPLIVKKYLLDGINANRVHNAMLPLPKTPFYDFIDKYVESILNGDNIQCIWLKTQGVTHSKKYSLEEAKKSLNTVFNFDGLKGYGGVDIENIANRLQQAKEWFDEYYCGADPFDFYEKIKGRIKLLQRHLSSIKADDSTPIQVRLIFELQVAFIMNCQDFLIEQIIHRRGRIHQSMDKVRQKTENQFRGNRIDEILKKMSNLVNWSKEVDKTVLKEIVDTGHPESTLARIKLLKSNSGSYKELFAALKNITNNFSEQDVKPHTDTAALFLKFARNEKPWKCCSKSEQTAITKNLLIIQTISKGDQDLLDVLVTDRIIEYIKNGKITFICSYKFQDICSLIKSVSIEDSELTINQNTLTQLQTGNFPIDTKPLTKIAMNKTESSDEDDLEESLFSDKIPFQDVITHVSRIVKDHNPECFDEHIKIFEEESDNMFSMEYDEDEFYRHLYTAIGALGRNLRYTDSKEFQNNRYFIQRYVSDRSLDLELSFMWKTLRDILGYSESAIIIDTMGIDSRRKSIFADYHGRYRTIGFADLRAISLLMFPVFSTNCKSTDSEAMNIMEILNHANLVLGGNLKIYTGNGHTTSRASAAMSMLSHKVIAAGRITHEPKPLSRHKIKQLITHLNILNKMGKILRTDEDLGRIISSRKHIYVDGIDVRGLIEDLGSLILWNVAKAELDIDNICQLVETSNRLKRVVRIIERGVTRAHNPNISIYLKSSELVLCICMLLNISTRSSFGDKKPVSKSSLQKISFFTPD